MSGKLLIALGCTALAGCGGESTTGSAARTGGVAGPTAAAGKAGAIRFEPGEWETTIEIIEATIPGMPAAMAEQMKKSMMARTTVSSCMTPEQAERPNEEMFAGKDSSCRFDRYRMADGTLDATMSCAAAPGAEAKTVITMAGRYAQTSFDLTNSMTAAPVPGHPKVAMSARVRGKRLGACRA